MNKRVFLRVFLRVFKFGRTAFQKRVCLGNSLSQIPYLNSLFPNFPIFPISQFKFSAFFYGESFSHIYNIFIKNIVFRDDSLHKYEMRKRRPIVLVSKCGPATIKKWPDGWHNYCPLKIAKLKSPLSYHGRVNEWMNEWTNGRMYDGMGHRNGPKINDENKWLAWALYLDIYIQSGLIYVI